MTMTPDELRALADAIVYRDSLAIARAADYLRAQADAQPVAWVDVTDSYEGPYIFRGKELLPAGRHDLYTHPAPAVPQAEPPQVFTRWVRDNMPPNTVISDPDWWAARLWRAAMRAHGIGGSDAE